MARSKSGNVDSGEVTSALPDPDVAAASLGQVPDAEVVLQPTSPDDPPQPTDVPLSAQAPARDDPRGARRGSVLLPLVLGGVIAAGLGAGASMYFLPNGWRPDTGLKAAMDGLATRIDDLQAAVAVLPPADAANAELGSVKAEIAAITDAQKDAASDVSTKLAGLADSVATLETRLAALEQTPASGDAAALASFRSEMEALKSQITAPDGIAASVQTDIAKAAADAAARIKAAEVEAAGLRAAAEADARRSAAQTAISHMRTAIDAGASLQPAIGELKAAGVTVPAAILDRQADVPSLETLRSGFTEAARDALAIALRETAPANWTGRLTAFLRAETGARSLVPQEGDDPDAILSRAEAALKAADVSAAINEVQAMPPGGKARMADWTLLAQKYIDLQAAVAALAATVK